LPFHHVTEKRLELARKAALSRLRKNMDAVITAAALDLRPQPDELVESHIAATQERLGLLGLKLNATRHAVNAVAAEAPTLESLTRECADRFNTAADGIDARLGFSVRVKASRQEMTFTWGNGEQNEYTFFRSLEILLFRSVQERLHAQSMREEIPFATDAIAAAENLAQTYDWMLDTLSLLLMTPRGIERQAHARDGLWNRKLRKTKQGVAMKRLAFQRDVDLALGDSERERLLKEFHRVLRAKHNNAQDQIRGNPEFKDFVLSRWLPHWQGDSPQPVTDEMIEGISGDKTG
jgi:hypothetical protein